MCIGQLLCHFIGDAPIHIQIAICLQLYGYCLQNVRFLPKQVRKKSLEIQGNGGICLVTYRVLHQSGSRYNQDFSSEDLQAHMRKRHGYQHNDTFC